MNARQGGSVGEVGIDSGMIKKMTAQEIGTMPAAKFKPALENIIAGMIIGMLMIGGGCMRSSFRSKAVIDEPRKPSLLGRKRIELGGARPCPAYLELQ